MKATAILLVLMLTGPWVNAAPPRPEDFAAGYELSLKGGSGLHHLTVPEKVYLQAASRDLADLRIFNGQGTAVPHLLHHDREQANPGLRRQELPFSPFYDSVPTGAVVYQSWVERGPEGAGKGSGTVATARMEKERARRLDGYIIETQSVKSLPYTLEFSLRHEADFLVTISMEGSDDLVNWVHLDRQTLASLNYRGHLLRQLTGPSINHKMKYLRLIWPADMQDIHIDSVTAVSAAPGVAPRLSRTRVSGLASRDERRPSVLYLDFENPGVLPVETVRIVFRGYRNLLQATLRTRSTESGAWIERGRGTFYRLQIESAHLVNDTFSIPVSTDRFWQLVVEMDEKASSDSLPDLELGWRPHGLYFAAQGPGPYVLAFGSGQLASPHLPLSSGLENLVREAKRKELAIPETGLSREIVLGGPERLRPIPPPRPWKKWLLWAVLVGGVLLIGRMAFTLHRQLNEQS